MQPLTEAPYYRRLGATEHALWLRDRSIPLQFALTAQVSGIIEPDLLINALDRLQQRHPLLRVKIALDEHNAPWFVEHQAPIPCRIVQRSGEQQWQQEVVQELRHPFDWTDAPLIRVVWLHSPTVSDVIVVCHHAIADGLAVVNLIRDLLMLLSHPNAGMPPCSIPPPLEALLPNRRTVRMEQILLARGLLGLKYFIQRLKPETNPRISQLIPNSVHIHAGTLSSEITTTLIHRCRKEETTVHGAICTAFLFAIALNQPNSSHPALKCFSPINLRPYLQSSPTDGCGMYIAPAQTVHPLTAESRFWQVARLLKSSLRSQAEANHLRQLAHQHEVLIAVKPDFDTIQQVFMKHCASDVMVTNLGRLAVPQQFDRLRLEAIYGPMVFSGFAQERVLGIATLGDRLSFTFVHQTSPIESKLVEQAMQLLEQATTLIDFNLSTAGELLLETNVSAN